MRAFALLLSLTLLVGGVPSVSFAQSLPSGSYVNSCTGISLVANVLEATCQNAQGVPVSAALPNPGSCSYGVLNSNGALACEPAPTTETTDGSANLTNTCSGSQIGYFAIAVNNSQSKGLLVILQPGQSVEIYAMKGTSYVSGCGAQPASNAQFKYLTVKPGG
jgi:hypothetical protein